MPSPKKSSAKKASPVKPPSKEKAKPAPKVVAKSKPAAKAKPEEKPKPELKPKAPPVPIRKMDSALPKAPPSPRPRPEPIKPEPEPMSPQKPQVDEAWQKAMRDMLAAQRQRLKSVVASTQAQMAEKSGDLADISDRASLGFEDELAVGLMAIEAAQIEDINEAIERIDNGSYGLCLDCRRAIPKKRLEVLPFAKRCLACEGQAERRSRVADSQDEEDDLD